MNALTHEVYGDALIATLNGPITRDNAGSFQEELLAALPTARHLILDLTDVDDVSGSGFRMLLHLYHQICAGGGETSLVGMNDELNDTIDATGLGEFFVVCSTLDEAIERICQRSPGHVCVR